MAQQQPSVLFEKATVSSQNELFQELQDANSAKDKLEVNMRGLEEKLSIAEREKVQLQKVSTTLPVKISVGM